VKEKKEKDNLIITRTERHIVKNNTGLLGELCFKSKNLYNYANYFLRQVFILAKKDENTWSDENKELMFNIKNSIDVYNERLNKKSESVRKEYPSQEKPYIGWQFIDWMIKNEKREDNPYRQLPSATSQQILKLLDQNWQSFFASIKDWKACPNKYKGMPKLPKYKHKEKGVNIVTFTGQQIDSKKNREREDGIIELPNGIDYRIKTKIKDKIVQFRIIPKSNHYVIEIVYQKNNTQENINKLKDEEIKRCIAIDLGINNLMTITNNFGEKPFIINGKHIKSINQYFNKLNAEAMSYVGNRGTSKRLQRLNLKRSNLLDDKFHKMSRYVVEYCKEKNVDHIIIGYNVGWKNEVDMGKVQNQKFVNIPYLSLIEKITYKSEEFGIKVIKNEESYTSKCDSLSKEKLSKQSNYLGKRKTRGQFTSGIGCTMNADVNGSLNIMRKVIGDYYIDKIIKEKLPITPYVITI
jgi:putative transposase